jgi:site-specific DNA-methyltransferase (adenine-specific)
MFEDKKYELFLGDALETMATLQDNSVDLILVDLPYGVTNNKWDIIIPFEEMWKQFNRIKNSNTAIILTATQPFSSMLVMSNLKQFKYDIIWEKTICSGQLNIKHQPLRAHESILLFYDKIPTYNEQKTEGTPYIIVRDAKYQENNYNSQKPSEKINDGFRHAKSVVKMSNPRVKKGHPTQKPNNLLEMLIKTYSNEDDVVLDCCMGSGSTGIAALNLNRKFIGIEKEEKYFEMATSNIESSLNDKK